jgi:hypothetical protein
MIVYLANKTRFRADIFSTRVGEIVFRVPALAIRSDDTLVVRTKKCETGLPLLPNLAGLAPAQPLGDAGLIEFIATIPFQHSKDIHGIDPNSSHSNSSSAFLGDLCAFVIKKSFVVTRGTLLEAAGLANDFPNPVVTA